MADPVRIDQAPPVYDEPASPFISLDDFAEDRCEAVLKVEPPGPPGVKRARVPLPVVYRPQRMTTDLVDAFFSNMEDDPHAFWRAICEVVESWELRASAGGLHGRREVIEEDADGTERIRMESFEVLAGNQIIPLDPDVLRYVPTEIGTAIMTAIREHRGGDQNFTSRRDRRRNARRR